MLKLENEEIEKIISILEWTNIATLAGDEEKNFVKKIIDKLVVARKTSPGKSVEISNS